MDGKRNTYDLNDDFVLIGNVRGLTNPGLHANMSLATKQGLFSCSSTPILSSGAEERIGEEKSKGLLVAPRGLD